MSAKEMFKELGYKQYVDIDYQSQILYSKKTNESSKDIEFNMQYKIIYLPNYKYRTPYRYELSLEELQAINKQIEELGW